MMPWPRRDGNEPINWGDEPVEPPPPPSAGRSVRLALGAVYDYLGSTVAASLLSFVLVFLAISFLYPGALRMMDPRTRPVGMMQTLIIVLIAILVLGPFTAGLYTLARNMFHRDDPHLFDIGRGAVRLARPAWALAFVQVFIGVILLGDIYFFLSRPGLPLKFAGVIVGYVALFWAMMVTYQWPLLVEQEKPLAITLKRSALLALANPFYTLVLTVLVLVLLLLPVATFFSFHNGPAVLIPVSLLWGALIASFQTSATQEILRKYDEPGIEPEGEAAEEAADTAGKEQTEQK